MLDGKMSLCHQIKMKNHSEKCRQMEVDDNTGTKTKKENKISLLFVMCTCLAWWLDAAEIRKKKDMDSPIN